MPLSRKLDQLFVLSLLACALLIQGAAVHAMDDDLDNEDTAAESSAGWTPIQLGVMEGFQLFSSETAVRGFGFGLGTLAQGSSSGLAFSPVYTRTSGVTGGIQAACHNEITRPAHGAVLLSFWNLARRDVSGVSLGAVNVTRRGHLGLQLGALSCYTRGTQNGFQLAGLFTTTELDTNGAQMSASWSKTDGNLDGIQLSGFTSTVGGDANGIQAGAFKASTAGTHNGVQLSGVLNLAADLEGIQAAVLYNEAIQLRGLQIAAAHNEIGGLGADPSSGVMVCALYNRSRSDFSGAQVSAVNHARDVRGIQFGLFNRASDLSGVQIGLINIQNGKLRFPLINIGFGGSDSDD